MIRVTLLSTLAGVFLATSLVSTDVAVADPDVTAQAGQSRNSMPKSKFSVDFGFSFANPESEVRQSVAGVTQYNNDDRDSGTITSLGIDFRIPLIFLFANVANYGNLANTGASGDGFYPRGPVAGAWGRVFLGGDDQTRSRFDIHPTPIGVDTHSEYSKDFFVMPYLGYEFGGSLGNVDVDVTPFVGVRLEQRKLKFTTNEAGNVSSFTNSETDVGFTFGVDIDFWIDVYNNVANTEFKPFVGAGFALDYSPSIKVSGRSPLNFDYKDEIDGGITPRFFIRTGFAF